MVITTLQGVDLEAEIQEQLLALAQLEGAEAAEDREIVAGLQASAWRARSTPEAEAAVVAAAAMPRLPMG